MCLLPFQPSFRGGVCFSLSWGGDSLVTSSGFRDSVAAFALWVPFVYYVTPPFICLL